MSTPAVQIRQAECGDLSAVAALEALFFEDCWSEKMIADAVKRSGVHLLVAEIDQRLIGYLLCQMVCDELELWRVAVAREQRSLGIARQMAEEMERRFLHHLTSQGLKSGKGWLEVRDDNGTAQDFYRAIGFRELSRRKNYYQSVVDAVVMVRDFEVIIFNS